MRPALRNESTQHVDPDAVHPHADNRPQARPSPRPLYRLRQCFLSDGPTLCIRRSGRARTSVGPLGARAAHRRLQRVVRRAHNARLPLYQLRLSVDRKASRRNVVPTHWARLPRRGSELFPVLRTARWLASLTLTALHAANTGDEQRTALPSRPGAVRLLHPLVGRLHGVREAQSSFSNVGFGAITGASVSVM